MVPAFPTTGCETEHTAELSPSSRQAAHPRLDHCYHVGLLWGQKGLQTANRAIHRMYGQGTHVKRGFGGNTLIRNMNEKCREQDNANLIHPNHELTWKATTQEKNKTKPKILPQLGWISVSHEAKGLKISAGIRIPVKGILQRIYVPFFSFYIHLRS